MAPFILFIIIIPLICSVYFFNYILLNSYKEQLKCAIKQVNET